MRNALAIALLGSAALTAPIGASAQSAGALLNEARASLASMKKSAAEVGKLADGAKDTDRIKFDCVNESYTQMQQDIQLAEATVEAATGWGVDVAAAALKSIRGSQQQINDQRAAANRCVGLAENDGVIPVNDEQTVVAENGEDDSTIDEDREGASFDPMSYGTISPTSSIPLAARAPAASPTK